MIMKDLSMFATPRSQKKELRIPRRSASRVSSNGYKSGRSNRSLSLARSTKKLKPCRKAKNPYVPGGAYSVIKDVTNTVNIMTKKKRSCRKKQLNRVDSDEIWDKLSTPFDHSKTKQKIEKEQAAKERKQLM